METKLLNISGQEVGKCEIPQEIFSRKVDEHFLHELVKYYLANKRLGTAQAKKRSDISGGGKKPWKQKGTGRARHGSNRSPLWRGGGVVFGPHNHSFKLDMPKTKRRAALLESLSAKYSDGVISVIENIDIKEAKTKEVREIFKALKIEVRKVLFVLDKSDEKFALASRNMKEVSWILARNINAYEILRARAIIFTSAGMKDLADFLNPKAEKASAK
ncbi:MAG: 50S ribosomal protein L4 [Elusimicrobiales bacterium]|nr:50S ribosomal protein L4 [Elusimicrobiales bacterium]